MQAHPTMEILPFGDAYLEAGCLVLKGPSPRGAAPQGLGCSAPSRPPSRDRHSRCREQAGWQATGALQSHLVISQPLSQPHTVLAHSVLQAGPGSTAMQGAGRGGATSPGKAATHPELLAWQGWPWITRQQEITQALGILPAAPGALLTPGHLRQQLSAPYQRAG